MQNLAFRGTHEKLNTAVNSCTTFLQQMIKNVDIKQRYIEKECTILRQLLKPWLLKTDIQPNNKGDKKCDDGLSIEEEQALSKVEQILNKARKTLNNKRECEDCQDHNKTIEAIKENQDQTSTGSTISKNPVENDAFTDCKNKATEKSSSVKHSVLEPEIKQNIHSTECLSKKLEVMKYRSTSQLEKLCTKVKNDSKMSNRTHIPAHQLAPFKTNPYIKIPKSSKHISARKQAQSLRPTSKALVNKCQVLPNIAFNPKTSRYKNEENNNKSASSDINTLESRNHTSEVAFHPKVIEKEIDFNDATNVDTKIDVCSSDTTLYSAFSLQENGNLIKLPSKLHRVVHKNQKLREKNVLIHLNKKVTETDASFQFVSKLESEMEVSTDLWTRVSALTCLRSHKLLLEALHSLHLKQVDENCSFKKIYQAKRTLEFVLSTFDDLQKDTDFFEKAHLVNPPALQELLKLEKDDHQAWFDTRDIIKGPKLTVSYYLNTDTKWTKLKFMESFLQLQLSLTKLVFKEWSAWITSTKLNPQVLQAVYGLTTTCGQFLPAFIKNLDDTNVQ